MNSSVALITGVSSGIGRATAELMSRNGFRTIGTARRVADTSAPAGVELVTLDVTDEASVQNCVQEVVARAGRIDVLVNNAGALLCGAVEETDLQQAEAIFETNFFGALRMVEAVLPIMRRQASGRIINVTSIAGYVATPFQSFYCATKHALEGFTESLDYEIRPFGVRAVAVAPNYIHTELSHNCTREHGKLAAYDADREAAISEFARHVDAGDRPETVARVILAAATTRSPKQHYVAGRGAAMFRFFSRIMPAPIVDIAVRRHFSLRA